MFDNHTHSQFSFDGGRTTVEASSRAAAGKGLSGICFTDHCDFFVPQSTIDIDASTAQLTDISAQQAEIDRVQSILPQIRILKGAEIGMHESSHEDIRTFLEKHQFDQVIASVHYLADTDPYYGQIYQDRDWKQAYGLYLETIYKEMTWLGDFDIMGHFDYIVRYAPYSPESILYKDFSDILDEMLKYLAHEGKALEINTKSYQTYRGRTPILDKDILLRYKELGGEILSFGSDAHQAHLVGTDFQRFGMFAKSLGFRWSAHFESRQLKQIPL